jgi:dihydroorotase
MSVSLLIKNVSLVDAAHDRVIEKIDIAIREGVIHQIAPRIEIPATEIIDATGLYLSPSIIDLGFHLLKPDLLRHELKVAAINGFSQVVTLPNETLKVSTTAEARLLFEVSQSVGLTEVLPIGGLMHLQPHKKPTEMYALQKAGCIGVGNGTQAIEDPYVLTKCLEYAKTHELTVFLHPIDLKLNIGCMHEGEISTRLGLAGIPYTAETVALARDLLLIEQTGVSAHISRISTARSVEMIAEAKKRGLPISCSVSLSHLLLCDEDLSDFQSHLHTYPPLRSLTDQKALQEGVRTGVIDAIVSDHLPLGQEDKCMPFAESMPGISTLDHFFIHALELVHRHILTLPQLVRALSWNPYRILKENFPHSTTLTLGAPAHFLLFSTEKTWACRPQHLLSHGKNTPLLQKRLKGRLQSVFLHGKKMPEEYIYG